jgi:hypothetical protein
MPLVSPPARRLLSRVLEDPRLPQRIASLPARELGRLVDKVGLEDAGELLAFATVTQLRDLFDEDLWAPSDPGDDATFDSKRFRVWLEVMLEAGRRHARREARLPPRRPGDARVPFVGARRPARGAA